jgi:CubicO group peptidase (beta-lactamase class C family)
MCVLARTVAIGVVLGLTVSGTAYADDGAVIQQRLDSYLRPYAIAGEFSGVALLANDAGVVATTELGYSDFRTHRLVTPNTAFRIASLSKTFTAAAIAILIKQGKLEIGAALSNFLPDFPNAGAITIEHLLLHKSGVGALDAQVYVTSTMSLEDLVKGIATQPPQFPPGTKSQYSNEGYIVLAAVIEKVTGKSYAGYVHDAILAPLHLTASGITLAKWRVDPHANGYLALDGAGGIMPAAFQVTWPGAGALHSSATDLLYWLRALKTNRLFDFESQRYPYGWGKRSYEHRMLIEQSGEIEGYVSYIALYPQDGYYVVLLSNIESGLLNRIGPDMAKVLFGGSPSVPPTVSPQTVNAEQLAQFAGDYRTPTIPVAAKIRVYDGKLVQTWGDTPFAHPMAVIARDVIFEPADFLTVTFVRGADGMIKGSDWSWDGSPPLPMTR